MLDPVVFPLWPANEREAGDEIDVLLMETWAGRDLALANRAGFRGPLDLDFAANPGSGTASFVDRIWVPPWAGTLIVPADLRLWTTIDPDCGWFDAGWFGVVLTLGEGADAISREVRLWLANRFGPFQVGECPEILGPAAGADETTDGGVGVWFAKEHVFEIPESWRGEEKLATWDFNSTATVTEANYRTRPHRARWFPIGD